jgi:hypothetical protein
MHGEQAVEDAAITVQRDRPARLDMENFPNGHAVPMDQTLLRERLMQLGIPSVLQCDGRRLFDDGENLRLV